MNVMQARMHMYKNGNGNVNLKEMYSIEVKINWPNKK